MLFDVAAFVVTSAALGNAAEVFAAPATPALSAAVAPAVLGSEQLAFAAALDRASIPASAGSLASGAAGAYAVTAVSAATGSSAVGTTAASVATSSLTATSTVGTTSAVNATSAVRVTNTISTSSAVRATGTASATRAVSAADAGAGVPGPFIGPQPAGAQIAVPFDQLASLRGVTLLNQLTLLSKPELTRIVEQRPEIVTELLASPPAAAEVAAWWARSSSADRARLRAGTPQLIGNLEGIPYASRYSANRLYVNQTIAELRADLDAGVGRAKADELETRLHMLLEVRTAIAGRPGELPRQLVSIDSTGEGRAVIVVGDLATADNVSFLVPGMFYGVDARVVPWTDIAAGVADEQVDWLQRLGRGDETTAVVSWIGYHTPTLVNVASMSNAREGRDALTSSLQGLRAARGAEQPYTAILAHSYGATTALLSLQEDDVEVDALAMVGSPGSPARSVADLAVRDGNVWVGAASWDPIPQSGVFGSQPTSVDYGAKKLGVDGGIDPVTGQLLTGTVSHNDYFGADSETLRNFAVIGIGADPYVMTPDGGVVAVAQG